MSAAASDAVRVGPATYDDLPAILTLYNVEIRDGVALWHTRERDLDEMTDWYDARVGEGYPVLVARGAGPEGAFLGYGSFGRFRASDGYAATVEHSLYVVGAARRLGVGRDLLAALEAEARAQRRHVMVGGVAAENAASIGLHRSMGFVETARLPEVGRKFDRWLTLVLLQKRLD